MSAYSPISTDSVDADVVEIKLFCAVELHIIDGTTHLYVKILFAAPNNNRVVPTESANAWLPIAAYGRRI